MEPSQLCVSQGLTDGTAVLEKGGDMADKEDRGLVISVSNLIEIFSVSSELRPLLGLPFLVKDFGSI